MQEGNTMGVSVITTLKKPTLERAPLPPLVVNPHRPDRVEPRAVKRRLKPYPLLMKPRRVARNALIQQSVGA
jgi:hypothetical protein